MSNIRHEPHRFAIVKKMVMMIATLTMMTNMAATSIVRMFIILIPLMVFIIINKIMKTTTATKLPLLSWPTNFKWVWNRTCSAAPGSRARMVEAASLIRAARAAAKSVCPHRSAVFMIRSGWLKSNWITMGCLCAIAIWAGHRPSES